MLSVGRNMRNRMLSVRRNMRNRTLSVGRNRRDGLFMFRRAKQKRPSLSFARDARWGMVMGETRKAGDDLWIRR